jgi:adenylate cyclase
MCAGGVPERNFDHARNVIEFASEMLETLKSFNQAHSTDLRVRVGINSGSVVAGVIGSKKFTYDVWGDAVNVKNRLLYANLFYLGCFEDGIDRGSKPYSSQSNHL